MPNLGEHSFKDVANSQSQPAHLEEPPSVSADRLLIVEDDPVIRELLVLSLCDYFDTVDQAPCGEVALEMIREVGYDCILLDLNLPGIGGLEAFKRTVAYDIKIADRIVFMTGDTSSQESTFIQSNLRNPLVAKPFSLSHIKRIIDSVISSYPNDSLQRR